MTDSTRLDEQVAIVTGAAQGIGRGIAFVLAGAGAKIVIGDIQDASDTAKEVRANGEQAVSMIMDTSKLDDARALVDLVRPIEERQDILFEVEDAHVDDELMVGRPVAHRLTLQQACRVIFVGSPDPDEFIEQFAVLEDYVFCCVRYGGVSSRGRRFFGRRYAFA